MKTITGLKIDSRGSIIVSWVNDEETAITSHYVLESFENDEASLAEPIGALAIHIAELNDMMEMQIKNSQMQDEINANSMQIQYELRERIERLEKLLG